MQLLFDYALILWEIYQADFLEKKSARVFKDDLLEARWIFQ
jgi:hypothetical protein